MLERDLSIPRISIWIFISSEFIFWFKDMAAFKALRIFIENNVTESSRLDRGLRFSYGLNYNKVRISD